MEVVSVNISSVKGVIKTPVEEGMFVENYGLEGDAHAGSRNRQVSILAMESIEKIRNKGVDVSEGKFAENITTVGIELYTLPIGTKLIVGEVLLEISQIGKDCHHGCAIKDQAGECVMPTEGVFANVLKGGKIKKGDKIALK